MPNEFAENAEILTSMWDETTDAGPGTVTVPTGALITTTTVKPHRAQQREIRLRPGLALVSIAAILSLSLEIEILFHIDGFSRLMTYREIALDAGLVLIGVLGLGLVWWLTVLAFVRMSAIFAWAKRHAILLCWSLWLSVPTTYLAIDLLNVIRIQLLPQWNSGPLLWVLFGSVLIAIVFAGFFAAGPSALQTFCRTRLAPIGWLHLVLSFIAAAMLWASGVYLFRDYVHPGKTVVASDLPDIYLITIDALRADDMSVYGYKLPTTPNLERFAQRSSTFEYFVANSNFTTSATTSIETGVLPWSHRVFQLWGFLHQRKTENLGAVLRQRGYYTAVISANDLASPLQHRTLNGYDAVESAPVLGTYGWGYLNFVGTNSESTLSISALGHLAKLGRYLDMLTWGDRYPFPAEAVFDQARSLVERSKITQPLFVWTHILPPHDPYWPPPAFRKRFLSTEKLKSYVDPNDMDTQELRSGVSAAEHRARYDEMVLYADHAVGDFVDWLDRTGRLDRSIVIVSADHGESFEHNWLGHTGPHLYTGLIHIPLLIHLPGQKQGTRVTYLAQQADLLPTILDLVDGLKPGRTEGLSLKPALQGRPLPERYVFSMNLEPNRVFDPITRGTIAVMDDEFEYVNYLNRHQEMLYRYKSDQFEEHNLIAAEPEVAKRMRDVLSEKLTDVNRQFTPKP